MLHTSIGIVALVLLASSFAFGQAPTITTVAPTKGSIGSSVVITGTGFGAAAANNIVWFGGIRGAITAASATSITVKVPGGATPGRLTVLNATSGLSVKSAAPFDVTFTGGVVNQCAFSNDVTDFAFTGTSIHLSAFTAADLNNDGRPELIAMALFYPYIWVIPNQSTPGTLTPDSFGDTLRFKIGGTSASSTSIAVGDFDGDGKIDIAVGNGNPAGVTLLRNTSSGATISFSPPVQVAGFSGTSMAVADLDFDGKPEIISGTTVYRNTSTPGTLSFVGVTMTYGVEALDVADLDADNKPDLAYVSGGVLYASRNTGTVAPFTSAFFNTRVTVGAYPQISVAIADVDGDGKPDLMTMDNYSGQDSLFIYKNATTATLNGTSFPSRVSIGLNFPDPTGSSNISSQVTSGDVDGDGKVDLVVLDRTSITTQNTYTIGILRNNTTPGTITATSFTRESFEAGTVANFLLVADLDADGRLDFVTSRSIDNSYVMTALRNTMTETSCAMTVAGVAPVITGFSPFTGAQGSSVVITGSNFNVTPSKMAVFFGGIKATVTAGSATSLTVTVPNSVVNERLIVLDTQTRLQAKTTDHFSVTSATHPLTAAFYNTTKDILIATGLSGAEPTYVSHADLDQDGKFDLIHRYVSKTNIHTTRNTSTSSVFSFPVDGQFSTQYIYDYAFPLADLNGDGKPEMMGSSYTTLNFWVNNYSGGLLDSTSFGPRQRRIGGGYSNIIYPSDFADFDGDGRPDMLMNGSKGQFDQSGGFSILRNLSANGSVSFSSKVIFPQTVSIYPGIGDINSDGKPDFVMVDGIATNTILIFQNQATAGSIATTDFLVTSIAMGGAAQSGYFSIYVTDLDGDHKPDIVVSHRRGFTILKNIHTGGAISAGSFAAPVDITNSSLLAGDPQLQIVDLDGDGKRELIMADVDGFFIYKNNTTPGTITAGSFDSPINVGGNLWVSDIADLNGDGVPELIAYAGGNVEILYNGTALPPNEAPVITSVTSTGLYVDAPITIDNVIAITDADDASLTGATMTISSGTLQSSEDKLLFSNQNGITGGYDADAGTLTLTGTASVANYQTALRTIQYQNTATTPITTARTITLTVTDGKDPSDTKSYVINFQGAPPPDNSPPVIEAQTANASLNGEVTIDLTGLISDPDGNLDLATLTIVSPPQSGAVATLSVSLQLTVNYSAVNFTGLDQLTLGVCDLDDLCVQQIIKIEVNGELRVYNGISPNGDHRNDSFWIDNIATLPDTKKNHVSIYGRWGDLVFETDDYDNTTHVFDGRSKSGSELPSGTYFYKIQFASGRSTMTGYLMLSR